MQLGVHVTGVGVGGGGMPMCAVLLMGEGPCAIIREGPRTCSVVANLIIFEYLDFNVV